MNEEQKKYTVEKIRKYEKDMNVLEIVGTIEGFFAANATALLFVVLKGDFSSFILQMGINESVLLTITSLFDTLFVFGAIRSIVQRAKIGGIIEQLEYQLKMDSLEEKKGYSL